MYTSVLWTFPPTIWMEQLQLWYVFSLFWMFAYHRSSISMFAHDRRVHLVPPRANIPFRFQSVGLFGFDLALFTPSA